MTKTIPASPAAIASGDFSAGEQALDAPVRDVGQELHYEWSRSGERAELLHKTLNAFETSSATYTTSDEGAEGADLDSATVVQLIRPVLDGASLDHQIQVRVYGRDFVARVTAYSPDAAASLDVIEITHLSSEGWGWSKGTLKVSEAAADDGGLAGESPRLVALTLEVKRSTTLAEVWIARAQEISAGGAQLPED